MYTFYAIPVPLILAEESLLSDSYFIKTYSLKNTGAVIHIFTSLSCSIVKSFKDLLICKILNF